MFRNRTHSAKTTSATTRAFRPAADRLEAREVLNASLFGNASMAFPGLTGSAVGTTPAFANSFGSTQSASGASFVGGFNATSIIGNALSNNTGLNVGSVTPTTQSLTGSNAGNFLSSFIHLPTNVNLNSIFANRGGSLLSSVGTGLTNNNLTSGFGTQSGLAFNNGLGGTGFGLGSNVGFNSGLFGSGLGATTGLSFNNGLGGTGTGASTNGLAATNGLAFTGGLGFNNAFNNTFNSLGSTFLGFGNNLNTALTNTSTFTSGLGGLNGAGTSSTGGLFMPSTTGSGFTIL